MSIFFLISLQYAAGFAIVFGRNKIEIYIYIPLNEFVYLRYAMQGSQTALFFLTLVQCKYMNEFVCSINVFI